MSYGVIARRRQHLVAAGVCIGVVVMVVGTFAPWLRSGQVTRNSYRTAGLLQRLLGIGGAAGAALDALPLLAFFCAANVVILTMGLRRTALAVVSLLAVGMGALALAALAAPTVGGVRVVRSGPIITLVGATTTIVAALGLAILWRTDRHLSSHPVTPIAHTAGECS